MAYTKDDIEKILSGEATFSYTGISTQPRYTASDIERIQNGEASFSYTGISPKRALIPEVKAPGAVAAAAPTPPKYQPGKNNLLNPLMVNRQQANPRQISMPLRTDVDMNRARQAAAGATRAAQKLKASPPVSSSGMIGSTGIRLPSVVAPKQSQPIGNTGIRLPVVEAKPEYKGALAVPSRPEGAPVSTAGKLLGAFGRGAAYGTERLGQGVLRAAEGVNDYLGSLGSRVLGLVSSNLGTNPNPISEGLDNYAKFLLDTDVAGGYGENIEQRHSPTDTMRMVGNLNEAGGAMLPAIATGGASASTAMIGLQAAGNAAAQAYHEGASLDRSLLYGTTSGLLEATIERISGGIPGLPEGAVTKIIKRVMDSPVAGKLVDILGEGGEEALSTFLDPYIRRAIYDGQAQNATGEEIVQSAAAGIVLSLVTQASMGGAEYFARRKEGGVNLPGVLEIARDGAVEYNQNGGEANARVPDQASSSVQAVGADREGVLGRFRAERQGDYTKISAGDGTKVYRFREPQEGILTDSQKGIIDQASIDGVKVHFSDGPIEMTTEAGKVSADPGGMYIGDGVILLTGDGESYRHELRHFMRDVIPEDVVKHVELIQFYTNTSSPRVAQYLQDMVDKYQQMNPRFKLEDIWDEISAGFYNDSSPEVWDGFFTDIDAVKNGNRQLDDAFKFYRKSGNHYGGQPEKPLLDQLKVERPQVEIPKVEQPKLRADDPIVRSINEAYGFSGESVSTTPPMATAENPTIKTPEPEIPEGFKERGYAESIRTKTDLPEELKNEFVSKPEIYKELSNRTTLERAENAMGEGVEAARNQFDALLSQKDPAAVPLGDMLAKAYMKDGNRDAAVEVLRQLSAKLTESGQFSQAAVINLLKNNPETALRYLQRQIDTMNAEGAKKFRNWEDFKLTDAEIDRFAGIDPGDTDAIKGTFDEIGKRIAREYPATVKEKLVEFSHVMMLLNPKTQVRNFLSNVAMLPMQRMSEKVSAVGQGAVHFFNPDFQPTQAFFVSEESRDIAREVYGTVEEQLGQNAAPKWENAALKGMRDKDVFKIGEYSPTAMLNKALPPDKQLEHSMMENVRRFTYRLLDLGDSPFVKKNFIDRLSSYIEARGITSASDVPPEAISTAASEAMKATFKDDNALASSIVYAKQKFGLAGEVLMPFTKTPANITMRAIDYSPAGLYTAWHTYVKNGRDAHLLIDNLSKGLTGTLLAGLGALLAHAGIITGKLSDNKREAAFQRQQGMQEYSIRLPGGTYISYDWAQPAATPLLIGAVISDEIAKEQKAGEFNLIEELPELTWKALTASGDAILNQSILQNIQDVLGGFGSPTENFANEFLELPQRLIPSVFGAAARVTDNTVRQTYSNGDMLGTQINRMRAKIPGMSAGLPASYDTWGHEISRSESVPGRLVQQLVAPWNSGSSGKTPLDDEIMRVYQSTGEEGVFPPKAEWSITYDGATTKLSNAEYSRYQKQLGDKSYEIVGGLFDEQAYRDASDAERAKMLQDAYEYANALAKMEAVGYKPKGWLEKALDAERRGVPADTYIAYKNAFSDLEGYEAPDGTYVSKQDQQAKMLLDDVTLTKKQKNLLDELMISDVTVIPRETKRDFSSPEALAISEMPEAARKLWEVPSVQKAVGSVENYEKVQKILAETGSDKDEYGNAVSGTAKPKAVREIASKLNVTSKNAEEIYNEVAVYKHSLGELSTKQRQSYEALSGKYRISEQRFLDCLNRAGVTEGTKGRNGKTISGSLKQNRYRALREMGLNDKAAKVFLSEVYRYKW